MAAHRGLGSYLVSVLPWGGVVSELKGTRHACMLSENGINPWRNKLHFEILWSLWIPFKKRKTKVLKRILAK